MCFHIFVEVNPIKSERAVRFKLNVGKFSLAGELPQLPRGNAQIGCCLFGSEEFSIGKYAI